MAKFINTFSVLFLALLLLGTFSGAAIAGNITVLRKNAFTGAGASVSIFINGKKVGDVGSGKTLTVSGPGGSNKIEAKITGFQGLGMNEPSLNYTAKGGGNYFIVGIENLVVTAQLGFEETSASGLNLAKRKIEKHKKRIMGGDPFAKN